MNFINLTNGLQAIEDYNLTDIHFIRIQSTWCEQKEWERILLTISDDFLMYAAIGIPCTIYDYGANKEIPRAIWQGLEWIKFVLTRVWYSDWYVIEGRGGNSMQRYFAGELKKVSSSTINRISYYKKFIDKSKRFNIQSITRSTNRDGSDYKNIISELK